MADTQIRLERELRTKLTRFLSGTSGVRAAHRQALFEVFDRIKSNKWEAVLFGGTLRDLMLYGPGHSPRDIDIVISNVDADQIAASFMDCSSRRTRFGGLHLEYRGWLVDVWSLHDTWAIKNSGKFRADFDDLPRTTFLNVEAVIADLVPSRGKSRNIRDSGFFDAISQRLLDINYEENPFPTLCVVRSLITAARLRFSISRKLCKYLLHHAERVSPEELVDVQIKHYGTCTRKAEEFQFWLHAI